MQQAGRRLGHRLAEAFASRWPFGLRAGLSVGIPLVAGALTHHASYGALASIGSFAGFYGPATPYRHRIRLVAGVGVALIVLVPLGSLCAATAWLSVVLIGLVAAAASFTCLALRVPPPREYLIVLGVLAATGIPTGLTGALREAALVAAGAVIGGLITMAPPAGPGARAAPAAGPRSGLGSGAARAPDGGYRRGRGRPPPGRDRHGPVPGGAGSGGRRR